MTSRQPLLDRVLGRDPKRRAWARMSLTSLATYVAYSLITATQVHFGFIDPWIGLWVSVAALALNAAFFGLVRSGWSERFAADPSLGVTQLLTGIVFFWVGYAIAGPGSLTMPVIVVSHIVYAMFGMPARHVRHLIALSLAGLALLMVACHVWQPARYPVPQQVLAMLYTTLVILLVARLAGHLTAMQERLRQQRNQLEGALAQVRLLAGRDELTELPNRRSMRDTLDQQQGQVDRGAIASLAMIDLDHFKRINDEHGHAAGDAVLRRVAAAGARTLRAADRLGRWGGEEFLVVMPGTGLADAEAVLRRLRQALAEPDAASGAAIGITFSAGVAAMRPGEPAEQCIARADEAMYRAKQAGRDRVERAPAGAARHEAAAS